MHIMYIVYKLCVFHVSLKDPGIYFSIQMFLAFLSSTESGLACKVYDMFTYIILTCGSMEQATCNSSA